MSEENKTPEQNENQNENQKPQPPTGDEKKFA